MGYRAFFLYTQGKVLMKVPKEIEIHASGEPHMIIKSENLTPICITDIASIHSYGE